MAGESVTYLISGITNLSAADFKYESSPAGGSGPFYAAVHFQNTGTSQNKSAWGEPGAGPITVPEPTAAVLFSVAGAAFWFRQKRSRSR